MCRMNRAGLMAVLCMLVAVACNRKTEAFNLILLANYDPTLKEGEKLPGYLQDALGVYTSDSCSNILFVPQITIKRTDAHPEQTDHLNPSLGFLGGALNALGLLSKSAYQENIRQSLADMNNPKILTDRLSGSMNMMVPAGSIIMDKRSNDHFANFKSDIAYKLWKKQFKGDVVIYFPDPNEPNQQANSNNTVLTDIFKQLSDTAKKPAERAAMISGLITGVFADSASIEAYKTDGHRGGQFTAPEYFNHFVSDPTLTTVDIIDVQVNPEGKLWAVKVLEHRKTGN